VSATLWAAESLGLAGRRGRTVGAWLDLGRALGPRYTWQAARHARMLDALDEEMRDALYRRIWSDAAKRVGAQFDDLGGGFYRVERRGRTTRLHQQVTELDDPVTLRLALAKPTVHRRLTDAGVPVPEHAEFNVRDPRPGREFLARCGGPCVVKPARGTAGGAGITAGVRSADELRRARMHAARYDERLLIERQAEGDLLRMLLLDGELLDAIRQRPPHLVGDGHSTMFELLMAENRRRVDAGGAAGLAPLVLDLDAVLALRRAGRTPGFVPAAGDAVALKSITNDNRVEDRERCVTPLPAKLVETARAAVSALELRLAGVDLIATGDSVVITDVNGTPGIHHHYLVPQPPADGGVAVPILERLLSDPSQAP